MKKTIVVLLTFLCLASVYSQNNKVVTIAGQILNKNNDFVRISNKTYQKKMPLDTEGRFSDTLHISTDGMYTFSDGRETTVIYLKENYNLQLVIDTKMFDETIKYTGVGSENNNFLAKKALIEEKIQKTMFALYGADEKDFSAKQDALNQEYESMLNSLKDKSFADYQKRERHYAYLQSLNNYESYHRYISKNDTFNVSDGFLIPVKSIHFDNEEDYLLFPTFKSLVDNHYLENINDTIQIKDVILTINSIKKAEIKKGVLSTLLTLIDISNSQLLTLYKISLENSDDEDFKAKLQQQFSLIEKLLPGNPSPSFSFKDANDKLVSLSDFKGKYVYVDVWATWCSPCRREIPFLKKIASDYQEKDIEFISISVDNKRAYDKWKKMIEEEKMTWHQLFADKSWQSDFVQAYRIKGIPTFILIDPKGNIVSASAMRPSNPQLPQFLDALLKKK